MNRRNFGRVIKRIEKYPHKWAQENPPVLGMPFCFIGHAQFIRTGSSKRGFEGGNRRDVALMKWLGLSEIELQRLFMACNTLDDFKRWHKAGKVGA